VFPEDRLGFYQYNKFLNVHRFSVVELSAVGSGRISRAAAIAGE
jgi:hypothetical protein